MAAEINEVAGTVQQEIAGMLDRGFQKQRKAYLANPVSSYEQRKEDLLKLKQMVNDNREDIIAAISEDYGNRSRHETQFADLISVTDGINDIVKHLKKWMKPQKRHVDSTLYPGGRNRVIPQPLGVMGIIVPWNFPVYLSIMPLAFAFAAGNRAMVKMSENSVALTRVFARASPKYFPEEKLAWFEETGGVGIEFSQIPFDMIMFTGSGQTGKAVMASAARNLTPVVLELGGKCPAVIDPEYPIEKAVGRIMFVKQFNAGQICTNVDYVFVHENQKAAFVDEAKKYVAKHCPDINHEDYTSIIDERAFDRLEATLEDARTKGATIVNLSGGQHSNRETPNIPMHLVLDTTENMSIRQRETEAIVDSGTWVYLPVQPDRETARNMALTMRDAGLGDAEVVGAGEWLNSVSLGFYVNHGFALERRAEARSLGFPVQVRKQQKVQPRYWLDYEQRVGAPYVVPDANSPIKPDAHRMISCGPAGAEDATG